MKPFDPKTAKNGDELVFQWRGVEKTVRFVGMFPNKEGYAVIVTEDGRLYHWPETSLYLKPKKRTIWVNLYYGEYCYYYDTEKEAKSKRDVKSYIYKGTYPLEIEE